MQREFFEILRERNREGTTVFLSSHVLSEVQRNCRRAAVIREGRIIACDSVEALGKPGLAQAGRGSRILRSGDSVRSVVLSKEGHPVDLTIRTSINDSGQVASMKK